MHWAAAARIRESALPAAREGLHHGQGRLLLTLYCDSHWGWSGSKAVSLLTIRGPKNYRNLRNSNNICVIPMIVCIGRFSCISLLTTIEGARCDCANQNVNFFTCGGRCSNVRVGDCQCRRSG